MGLELGGRGGENERREVIATIGTVEAFWQHDYLCARFSSFMDFFSSMCEIRGFVGSYANAIVSERL